MVAERAIDEHQRAITNLEDDISDMRSEMRHNRKEISDTREEMNRGFDRVEQAAVKSVPEWAARELQKRGGTNAAWMTATGGLLLCVVGLIAYFTVH